MPLIEEFRSQGNFLFRYRSFFPIPILLIGLGIHIYQHYTNSGYTTPEYFYAICFGISFLGELIRILVVGYSPENTSGRNRRQQVANVINTKGMYSTMRHPLYLGNFLMWLGIGLITQNIWFILLFMLFYWIYYERIMFAEEAFLREKFGKPYMDWAETVPAFIPNLRKWQNPEEYFSFKNVIRREYTSIFNLFLVFFIFRYAQSIITMNSFTKVGYAEIIWFAIMGFAIIFYVIIRFLHKKTRLLEVEGR